MIGAHTRILALATALGLALWIALPALAADGTLTLNGIASPIAVQGHSDNLMRDLVAGTAGNQGSNRLSPIRVTKAIDEFSPVLWNDLATGTTRSTAKLELFDSANPGTPYLTIDLENSQVVEISVSADTEGNGNPREIVGLAFDKVTWTHSSGSTTCWNVLQAQGC